MPHLYFELRGKIREQIRAKMKKEPSDNQLEELLETLVRVGTEIDEAVLSSAGRVIFNDHTALFCVDPKALNAVLPELRASRKRAMEIWRPEWFTRITAQARDQAG